MSEQQAAELLVLMRQMAADIADLKRKVESMENGATQVAAIANRCFDGAAVLVRTTVE